MEEGEAQMKANKSCPYKIMRVQNSEGQSGQTKKNTYFYKLMVLILVWKCVRIFLYNHLFLFALKNNKCYFTITESLVLLEGCLSLDILAATQANVITWFRYVMDKVTVNTVYSNFRSPSGPEVKTYFCGQSPAVFVGFNPKRDMELFLLWVLSGRGLWRRTDHMSRAVLPTVFNRVWSTNMANEASMSHWWAGVQNRTQI